MTDVGKWKSIDRRWAEKCERDWNRDGRSKTMREMTEAEAIAYIVQILQDTVGDSITFEARDEARDIMSKALDTWYKRANTFK